MQAESARFLKRYLALVLYGPTYAQAIIIYIPICVLHGLQHLEVGALSACAVGLFIVWLYLVLAGEGWLAMLGFRLTGLRQREVPLAGADSLKLAEAMQPIGALNVALSPALVNIGAAPFIWIGGPKRNSLWISTHTLRSTPTDELRCLIAHERARMAMPEDHLPKLCVIAVWGVAWPICFILPHVALLPLGILALALLWRLIWPWLGLRHRLRADRLALKYVEDLDYPGAVAKYAAQFAGLGITPLIHRRLHALGLSADAIRAYAAEVDRQL